MVNIAVAPSKAFARIRCSQKPALVSMCLRKVTRNHRIFANDEAALKVVYLAIENISKKWTMPIRDWKPALNRFAIEFEGRFPSEFCL